jgi:hypothetical protein
MTCEFKAGTGEFTLPEVSEANAPESVQAIYRDIRRLSGVPMVALIFRHIATYPEILDEVWTSIGPLFRGGRIQDTAWRIAKLVSLAKPLPRLEPDTRDMLGLAGQEPPPAIPGPLPPMVAPEAMDPSLRSLINDFGFGDRSKLDAVVPSLFRHLAHWPKYLATLHISLLPRFRDHSVATASNDLQKAMIREAGDYRNKFAASETFCFCSRVARYGLSVLQRYYPHDDRDRSRMRPSLT